MVYYVRHIILITKKSAKGYYTLFSPYYISVEIQYRNNGLKQADYFDGVTTMREVFYGVISQGVAPYFIMEQYRICSFFGHRDVEITDRLYATTAAEILKSVELGCRVFYFGGYGNFDGLCYEIVTAIRKEKPWLEIKRIYCVAQERYLRKRIRYFNREDYDGIVYLTPSFEGWYKSIYFRNRAMIDESDLIIFYAEERKSSGAYKALKYAQSKKGKRVVNLFEVSDAS